MGHWKLLALLLLVPLTACGPSQQRITNDNSQALKEYVAKMSRQFRLAMVTVDSVDRAFAASRSQGSVVGRRTALVLRSSAARQTSASVAISLVRPPRGLAAAHSELEKAVRLWSQNLAADAQRNRPLDRVLYRETLVGPARAWDAWAVRVVEQCRQSGVAVPNWLNGVAIEAAS